MTARVSRGLIEAIAWRVAAETSARFPERIEIIETHPGGGTYDCLTMVLAPATERCERIDRNRNGSAHVCWADDFVSVSNFWERCAASDDLRERVVELSEFTLRSQIIWAKRHLPISRGHYHWRHEPCYYAVRNGASARWIGDRRQDTVWDDISLDPNVEGGHSTQKPTELMARAIRNHRGDVYDPFVGSGTTIIASEVQGRRCFAMDVSPTYCDVARIRWENFTGERATREEHGP